MIIKITPQTLDGTIHVPASKSMTHRELIASALAKASSTLRNVTMSKDIEATIRILCQFGAVIDVEKGEKETLIHVTGGLKKQEGTIIADAGESGSTLRFLIPIGIYSGNRVQWTGHGRLSERRSRLTTTFSMKKALRTRLNPADCLSPLKENGKAAFSSSREM